MSKAGKKLQVFVSSTFLDMQEERQAAVEAILQAGHIPAGMELFSASNQSQLETIYRWISECDVYLLIMGGRYGTLDKKARKSYVELEYEYALSQSKPHFSLVISRDALTKKVAANGTEVIELLEYQKLIKFRDRVLLNISAFFDDSKDIKTSILNSLRDFEKDEDLSGWVSGKNYTEAISMLHECKLELARLHDSIKEARKRADAERIAELTKGMAELIEVAKGYADLRSEVSVQAKQDNLHRIALLAQRLYTDLASDLTVLIEVSIRNFPAIKKISLGEFLPNGRESIVSRISYSDEEWGSIRRVKNYFREISVIVDSDAVAKVDLAALVNRGGADYFYELWALTVHKYYLVRDPSTHAGQLNEDSFQSEIRPFQRLEGLLDSGRKQKGNFFMR